MRQLFAPIIRKPLYLGFCILGFMSISLALASGFDVTLSGIFGTSHTPGSFTPSGNAGQITISPGAEPCNPTTGTGQLCYDSSTQSFSGWVFSETVGWVQFGVAGYPPITAILPIDANSLTPWTLTGYAWSDNAGWITLGCLGDCSYSGVAYIPNSTVSFTGTAWSDTLGYIEFGTTGTSDFINKVKVIGSTAGGSAWSVNYDIGNTYDTFKLAPFISQVRQNVALLTRNAGTGVVNTDISTGKKLGNIKYYKLNGQTLIVNTADLADIRSIIVEGGDIQIARDIVTDTISPKAIIAIRDSTGNGGNIFIEKSVKNIYSSLIAEGALYSGENATTLYNDTRAKIANLPKSQLYVYGNFISHNTIGGALKGTPSCPYTVTDCDYDMAIRYDLNYFRSYDKQPIHQSDQTEYGQYSMIIERDPQVITNPPPGMKTLK